MSINIAVDSLDGDLKNDLAVWLRDSRYNYFSAFYSEIAGAVLEFGEDDAQRMAADILEFLRKRQ
jgi:hypothetical protein